MSVERKSQTQAHREALAEFQRLLMVLPDPRRSQGRRYPLPSVVLVALMAMVCGCNDAEGMALWGDHHEKWLGKVLDLPHGPPTQDVILSVFAALRPSAFSELFVAWVAFLRGHVGVDGKHIAIDGKTSRRSHDRSTQKPAVHTVSAWLSEEGLVLGQRKTGVKSNEITAIPELLRLIDIRGATITTDAMGCQTEIARTILAEGGEYLLAVKDNQPTLHAELHAVFADALDARPRPQDQAPPLTIEVEQEADKGHGRVENRTVLVCRDLSWVDSEKRWAGLAFVATAISERTDIATGKTTVDQRYFIGSDEGAPTARIATLIRRHWSVENELHWVLDMGFNEDAARHRAGHCADNFATLRHMALNMVKKAPGRKLGVPNTRMQAGWDMKLLVRILTGTAA